MLILGGGRAVAGGTLEEIIRQFSDPQAAGAPPDLEEIFFRATGRPKAGTNQGTSHVRDTLTPEAAPFPMPMFSALLFLQVQSFKNRLWQRLRRLRSPRYLFGALIGGLYFASMFSALGLWLRQTHVFPVGRRADRRCGSLSPRWRCWWLCC